MFYILALDKRIQNRYNHCMQTQTFNIALPKDLVKAVDRQAKKEFKNRSELIRDLLQKHLERKEKWERIFAYGRRKGKEMGIKSEKDIDRIVYEFRHGRKSS